MIPFVDYDLVKRPDAALCFIPHRVKHGAGYAAYPKSTLHSSVFARLACDLFTRSPEKIVNFRSSSLLKSVNSGIGNSRLFKALYTQQAGVAFTACLACCRRVIAAVCQAKIHPQLITLPDYLSFR